MAIASYFFVGTAGEASANEPTENKAEFYRVMDSHIKPIYEILTNQKCPSFELVGHEEDYSIITQAFPSQFTAALKSFDEDSFETVLAKWTSTEDAPYDNERDHRDLLRSLIDLSKEASEEKNLYLWNCL